MKQISLFQNKEERQKYLATAFGGELLRRKRKSRRPLNTRRAIHLVLRADVAQSGSLLNHANFINCTIQRFAKKFAVKIYERAVPHNHIHLTIKVGSRESYANFVRALAGVLAQALKVKWILRPYTRVVYWGRDFKRTNQYVVMNEFEAWGLIAYQPRVRKRVSSA